LGEWKGENMRGKGMFQILPVGRLSSMILFITREIVKSSFETLKSGKRKKEMSGGATNEKSG